MPSAQVIDINNQPIQMPASSPGQHDFPWLIRSWLWWKHHKFLSTTLLCLIAAIATISIVSYYHPTTPLRLIGDIQPTIEPTPTPNPAQLTQENAFYAALPESLLYYSYTQTTDSQNIFQSDPTNDHRRDVAIGLPNKYSFATSPNGQRLVRWTDSIIELSTQAEPQKFSKLFISSNPQQRINSLIWSADSNSIAFNLSQATNEQTGGLGQTFKNTLYTLTMGQKPSQVLNQTKLFQYHLVAFTAADKLYFTEDTHGVWNNLQRMDPTSATISQAYSFFPVGTDLAQMVFSKDMSVSASFSQTQVTLYNLSTQTSTVVYTVDRSCPHHNQENKSSITALAISPSSDALVLSTNIQPCDTYNPPNPNANTDSLTVVNITKPLSTVVWSGRRVNHISQILWLGANQTDGWLWLSSIELSQLFNLSNNQIYSVPKQREQNQGKDRVYYIGWLSAKK